MKKLLFVALMLIAVKVKAQTCTATSTSAAAVQTALNSCIAGGTVIIPAGSATWTVAVSIAPTGPLTIQGATVCTAGCTAGSGGTSLAFTDNTIITSTFGTNSALVVGPCSATVFCTITGITFINAAANAHGQIAVQGTHGQVSFRIHHLHMECSIGTGVNLFAFDGYGLIDHYLANDTSSAATECTPINMGGDFSSVGAQNWIDSTNFGTNQSIILEDSNFVSSNGGTTEGAYDAYFGCKVTVRNNIFTNFEIGGPHGTDSGFRRSCVLQEIYNNTLTNNSGSPMQVMNTRGGSLVFTGNTIGGSSSWTFINLQYFRVLGVANTSSWGRAGTGLNWTPISAVSSNSLYSTVTLNAPDWQASHSYTCSSGSPCLIGPLLHNAGGGVAGAGGFNYEATASCTSSGTEPNPWNQTFPNGTQSDGTCTWTTVGGGTTAGPGGSGFLSTNPDTSCTSGGTCTRFLDAGNGVYPFRDQPGRVHDQVLAPNYACNNTLPGSLSASTLLGTDPATASIIQSGVDYFNATCMPGYTPYTYPDPLQNQTWYVNGNGDTRFSSNNTAGHCDGTNPQSYAAAGGTGTNLHCAFLDIRSLWTDGTRTSTQNNFPAWGWIGAGGDTYLVDCTGGALCRIGQNGPNSGDWYGLAGDPFNAGAPSPPAGASGAHTKILGICTLTSCNRANLAQVNGGYGVTFGFNLTSTSFVDVQGFDLTQLSNCQKASSNANFCASGFPLDDYMENAIIVNNSSSNITLTDLNIHGTAVNCIRGAVGGDATLLRVVMTGCPSSGWNMDDGSSQTGFGNLLISHSVVYLNGCMEAHPIVTTFTMPWGTMGGVTNCAGQSSGGGYGDGIGTTTTTSLSPWHIDLENNTVAYNTQDGFDLLHVVGTGNTVKMNGNLAYGNMGQQLKIGAQQTTLTNNLITGSCGAMGQTSPAPLGTLVGFNTNPSFGADFCRAGGSTVAVAVSDAGPAVIAGNTMIAANYIGYEIDDPVGATCTSLCTAQFQDNVNIGFQNSVGDPPGNGNQTTAVFLVTATSVFSNTGSKYDHNASFNGSAACPNTGFGETFALCTTPGLVDQSFHQTEFGNMAPSSGSSSIVAAGIAVAGLTTDHNGVTRPNPPSMGAIEFNGVLPTTGFGTFKMLGTVHIP